MINSTKTFTAPIYTVRKRVDGGFSIKNNRECLAWYIEEYKLAVMVKDNPTEEWVMKKMEEEEDVSIFYQYGFTVLSDFY